MWIFTRKKIKSSGFTLIEVLVASVMLSSIFFAILTLISNNTHLAKNLEHAKAMDGIFLASRACIESFWYNNLTPAVGSQWSVNFGAKNLGCFTGSYNSNLAFTGITLESSNDTETGSTAYWSYFTAEYTTGSLRIYETITDGTEKREYDFLVGK